MRLLFNRANPQHLTKELEAVQDVMSSKLFVLLDILVISLLLTVLLLPMLKTIGFSILFFIVSYIFNVGLFFLIRKWCKGKSG